MLPMALVLAMWPGSLCSSSAREHDVGASMDKQRPGQQYDTRLKAGACLPVVENHDSAPCALACSSGLHDALGGSSQGSCYSNRCMT